MARSKKLIAEKKLIARNERREQRHQIIVESNSAARVVCETCGTEQAYRITGDGTIAPCVGPFDLGICSGEICITTEAYNEYIL